MFRFPAAFFLASCWLLLQTSAGAQALRASQANADSPGTVRIEIALRSPRGKEPAALQWNLAIPTQRLTFPDAIAAAGPAARSAGKLVNCAARAADLAICVVSGGQERIPNGVVAVLRLAVAPHTPRGTAQIRIDGGIAVFPDLSHIALGAVTKTIRISP